MIVVYGLVTGDVPVDLTLDDGVAPIRAVRSGPLAAIVAEHDTPPARTTESATRHAAVVAEVTERLPAAPVRFGVWYHEEAGLHRALEGRADELLAVVEHVAGAVEVVVRPAVDVDQVPAAVDVAATEVDLAPVGTRPGTAYLAARLAETQQRRATRLDARQQLLEATALLETRARDHRLVDGRHGLERCFLVDRADAPRLVALASTIAGRLDLIVGGPWPPYTFADPDVP